jgi:hypothetical protein
VRECVHALRRLRSRLHIPFTLSREKRDRTRPCDFTLTSSFLLLQPATVPVPEPSMLFLLGLGLAALAGVGIVRRRSESRGAGRSRLARQGLGCGLRPASWPRLAQPALAGRAPGTMAPWMAAVPACPECLSEDAEWTRASGRLRGGEGFSV